LKTCAAVSAMTCLPPASPFSTDKMNPRVAFSVTCGGSDTTSGSVFKKRSRSPRVTGNGTPAGQCGYHGSISWFGDEYP
jgi:hypothetical protein